MGGATKLKVASFTTKLTGYWYSTGWASGYIGVDDAGIIRVCSPILRRRFLNTPFARFARLYKTERLPDRKP